MSDSRTDGGKLCAYCLTPIEYQRLNDKASAGACRKRGCCYHDKVHIKTSDGILIVDVD